MPEKFLFQLRNSTDPNCVITSRWWGKSCSCSCRGPLPAALPAPRTHCHRGGDGPSSARSWQDGTGTVLPLPSNIRMTGAAAGLQLLFGISGSPRGKRNWHGWSSPLGGNPVPLRMHVLPQRCCTSRILPKAVCQSLMFIFFFPADFFFLVLGGEFGRFVFLLD